MAYTISNTSGSTTYSVTDGRLNSTDLDLVLVGRGYIGYGNTLNTNFVKLLENFSNTEAPTRPITGQLWYDTVNSVLKVYNGSTFVSIVYSSEADAIIGGIRLYSGNVYGQSTNANVNIVPNGTGYTVVNKLGIVATNTSKLLYTAANGTVQSTTASYTFAGDTIGVTSVNATYLSGTMTTGAQGSITSLGTLTSLGVTGTSTLGAVTAATVSAGTIGNTGASIVGTISNVAQPNITSVGTLTGLTSSGNIVAASTTNSTSITTGSLVAKGGVGIANDLYVGGTIYGAVNGGISVSSINNTPIGNSIASTGGFTTLSATGTFTVNNGGSATAIANGGTNGVGNIGSSSTGFNTIFAKAASAQYADLAELYESDSAYDPGTVVDFGGEFDITISAKDSTRVAGVISTNPAYLMNSSATGDFMLPVALTGRVPCKVIGEVQKGDILVSDGNGYASVNNHPNAGTIIGKALRNHSGGIGIIEVVVGRY